MAWGAPRGGGNKYHAKKTWYAGEEYDSRGEAEQARRLDLLKAAGQIRDWKRGREWVLLQSPTGKAKDGVTLTPDFEVTRLDGTFYVLDFKGTVTREFRLKAKFWKAIYPTVPLWIVKADGLEVAA